VIAPICLSAAVFLHVCHNFAATIHTAQATTTRATTPGSSSPHPAAAAAAAACLPTIFWPSCSAACFLEEVAAEACFLIAAATFFSVEGVDLEALILMMNMISHASETNRKRRVA
jgi:hypothetical protein